MRLLYTFLFKLFSWKFEGKLQNDLNKFIVIVIPHTSNWDFPLGIMVRSILRLNSTKYLGKSQLFKPPFGFIFRSLGGYPVDRSKNNNLVDAVVELFNSKEKFSIALAPEGTRKKVPKLKKGFYYISKKAKVPIIMIGFDYQGKCIKINEPFLPSDNILKDFKYIIDFFSTCKGVYPENGVDESTFNNMKKELEEIQKKQSQI